jgi:hypothetical protein
VRVGVMPRSDLTISPVTTLRPTSANTGGVQSHHRPALDLRLKQSAVPGRCGSPRPSARIERGNGFFGCHWFWITAGSPWLSLWIGTFALDRTQIRSVFLTPSAVTPPKEAARPE